MYFENVESVTLKSLTFSKIVKVQAIEGGAIYMKNYLNAHIKNNVFPQQTSLVRGGAIYLAQPTTGKYMGQEEYAAGSTIIEGNVFT